MTDILRALKIKSGTVKRLSRDVTYAQEESASERTRLQKLTSSGGDEYEVRAQEKVIKDADQMVPDYRSRLKSAIEDLESLIESSDGTGDEEKEGIEAAQSVIQDAKKQL